MLLRVQEYILGTQLLSDSGQQHHLYIYVYHNIMISQSIWVQMIEQIFCIDLLQKTILKLKFQIVEIAITQTRWKKFMLITKTLISYCQFGQLYLSSGTKSISHRLTPLILSQEGC